LIEEDVFVEREREREREREGEHALKRKSNYCALLQTVF
jgi:hypothetical protein